MPGLVDGIIYQLYKEADEAICESCSHKGCDVRLNRYGVSFICENCGYECACVDVESPNEAEVYY